MGGFVETRDGIEHPLTLEGIGELTPETHPELLASISTSMSKHSPSPPPAEALHADTLNQDTLSLTSLPKSPPFEEKVLRQRSSGDSLSPPSTPPIYHMLVTEAAIHDKSKTNALAKLITVAQTTWFLLQFIERWAAHQPRTELEVMTVAYAALNAVVYALWWNKPYNVDEAINISGRAHDRFRTRTIGLWSQQTAIKNPNRLIIRDTDPIVIAVFVPAGVLFGGLHCLAWRYQFPTEEEAILWRVCAAFCAITPVTILVPAYANKYWALSTLTRKVLALDGILSAVGYPICRLILFGITVSSLRRLPAGVFEATAWTRYIPHIS